MRAALQVAFMNADFFLQGLDSTEMNLRSLMRGAR